MEPTLEAIKYAEEARERLITRLIGAIDSRLNDPLTLEGRNKADFLAGVGATFDALGIADKMPPHWFTQ